MIFALETHKWRGIGRNHDLLHFWLRLGWFSVGFDRVLLSDLIRKRREALINARNELATLKRKMEGK